MRTKLMSTVALAGLAVLLVPQASRAEMTIKMSGSYDATMSVSTESAKHNSQAVEEIFAEPAYPAVAASDGPPPVLASPATKAIKGVPGVAADLNSPKSLDFSGKFRLKINPEGKSGDITYGAVLRVDAAGGKFGYSRAYGYVSAFGATVNIGKAGNLGWASAWAAYGGNGSGGFGMDNPYGNGLTVAAPNVLDWGGGSYIDVAAGGGNKFQISYSMMGASLGVSYEPIVGAEGGTRTDVKHRNGLEIAVKYSTGDMLGPIAVDVAAGGYRNDATPSARGAAVYGVSLGISAFNASIGANFTDGGITGTPRTPMFKAVGLKTGTAVASYGFGDIGLPGLVFGGYYGQGYGASSTSNKSNFLRAYGVGMEYSVVPGMSLFLAGDNWRAKTDGASNRASTVTLGTTITF